MRGFATGLDRRLCDADVAWRLQAAQRRVLGKPLDGPADIERLAGDIEMECMDLLQAAHTWSGIEMALWDLLGKKRNEPVYRVLGYKEAFPKFLMPRSFSATRRKRRLKAAEARANPAFAPSNAAGVRLAAPVSRKTAINWSRAREGLGADGMLLIDAGQIWREDVDQAAARLPMLEEVNATWLEEPFHGGAYDAYAQLAARSKKVKTAGGEASHNYSMARQLIDYGKVAFVQIDCGRIGGIGPAKRVADYAKGKGVTYVNHTFTSHLALCASLQPYAGLKDDVICEYPFTPKSVAWDLCANHISPDANGEVRVPERPGLGIDASPEGMKRYLVDVEIAAKGKVLYRTPKL